MAALLTLACVDLKPEPAPPVRWLDLNPRGRGDVAGVPEAAALGRAGTA